METFGKRLTRLRLSSKKRVADLAKEIGISIQAWTDYEKNKSLPQVEKLILISRYFKTSVDYLLFGNELEFFPPTVDDVYSPYIACITEMIKFNIIKPKEIKNIKDNIVFESNNDYIKMFVLSYLKINKALKDSFSQEDICEMAKSVILNKKSTML